MLTVLFKILGGLGLFLFGRNILFNTRPMEKNRDKIRVLDPKPE